MRLICLRNSSTVVCEVNAEAKSAFTTHTRGRNLFTDDTVSFIVRATFSPEAFMSSVQVFNREVKLRFTKQNGSLQVPCKSCSSPIYSLMLI